jgi:hypothetical protein
MRKEYEPSGRCCHAVPLLAVAHAYLSTSQALSATSPWSFDGSAFKRLTGEWYLDAKENG